MARTSNGGAETVYATDCEKDGFRTLAKRYFMDPVLPLLALLCMSALTVATIVLLVVTTADARFGHGGADTRNSWEAGPAFRLFEIGHTHSTGIPTSTLERETFQLPDGLVDHPSLVARRMP